MTDAEFDVLDELYFVISFRNLLDATSKTPAELTEILRELHRKGWVKVMETIDEELSSAEVNWDHKMSDYYYLATKSGLLAHNS